MEEHKKKGKMEPLKIEPNTIYGEIAKTYNDVVGKVFKEKEKAEELAKEAQLANEAKSDFLSNISHEIRTPLNGVIAATELIEQDELNKQQTEMVEIIRKSGITLMSSFAQNKK